MNIDISIIVPVYNVEKYLSECIDSLLKQQDLTTEIICVDDCSTDDSLNILGEYGDRLTVLRHQKNMGLSATRNTGLKYAKGKYILFVDSDDYILDNSLFDVFLYAERHCAEITFFNMTKFDDETHEKICIERDDVIGEYNGFDMLRIQMEKGELKGEACRQLFLREFLDTNKLYFREGILHEDILFYFMCFVKAKKTIDYNKSIYMYRQRSNSICSCFDYRKIESLFCIICDIFTYWKTNMFSDSDSELIEEYLRRNIDVFNRYRCDVPNEKLHALSKPEKFIYSILFGGRQYNYLKLEDKHIKKLREANRIYIYGAGVGAKEVVDQLLEKKIKIEALLVNDIAHNPSHLSGIPVTMYRVDDSLRDNSTVVIGVNRAKSKYVIESLLKEGYNNIIEPTYLT